MTGPLGAKHSLTTLYAAIRHNHAQDEAAPTRVRYVLVSYLNVTSRRGSTRKLFDSSRFMPMLYEPLRKRDDTGPNTASPNLTRHSYTRRNDAILYAPTQNQNRGAQCLRGVALLIRNAVTFFKGSNMSLRETIEDLIRIQNEVDKIGRAVSDIRERIATMEKRLDEEQQRLAQEKKDSIGE